LISRGIDNSVIIDLDERGWTTTHAEWMRGQARWFLVRKTDMYPLLWMNVVDGEQPYYVCRHVGIATAPPSVNGTVPTTQVPCYGLGKKRLDGHTDRIWLLPNGAVTLGDDVEIFAMDLVKASLMASTSS
jgi:hypothetical protein